MKEIKNILICGLGAIGTICASSIQENKNFNLKILVDENRYERYSKSPTIFNEKEYLFDYILPTKTNFKADLIIIATKNDGLREAIKNIKNFIHEETIIISLLNGIHSEEEIQKEYKNTNVITSFCIGNSSIRKDRKITHDGVYKILFGSNDIKSVKVLSTFFDITQIKYEISKNIKEAYWKKFIINVGINQICAAENKCLTELKKEPESIEFLKGLMQEAKTIATHEGITNAEGLYKEAEHFLLEEMPEATPSMLQDIRNKNKTEIDILAEKVMELGCKHGIRTPYNEKIFYKIKEIERSF